MTSPAHVPLDSFEEAPVSLPPRAIVISGTLGSGKTTLLNHLLQTTAASNKPGSFVVIENDIGATNTDKQRLRTSPENVLEVTAGCICCNDLHSLQAAVTQLRAQPEITTLFIETTGIAKPSAVKNLLHKLEIPTMVIVTVDVKHFSNNTLLGRTADTIPHADIVALTWTQNDAGIRDNTTLHRVITEVERLNPIAKKIEISPLGEPLGELSLDVPFPLVSAASFQQTYSDTSPQALVEIPLCTPGVQIAGKALSKAHQEFTITLNVPSDMSPDAVITAVKAGSPTGLLRAKGRVGRFDLDCTIGDWNISECRASSEQNFITLIGGLPLTAESFPELASTTKGDELSIDMSDPLVREKAVQLVSDLMSRIPTKVVENGRLITETDAGEAWRYVSLPGFPAETKEAFLRSLCKFYLKQHESLNSGAFESHTTLPYYQREVGYNLSWFLIDCGELLAKWGLDSIIRDIKPVTLYFTGLQNARDARHIGSFKESDVPYLRTRLVMLKNEGETLDLAQRAIQLCATLCLDRSWNLALRLLNDTSPPSIDAGQGG
jgi:G3E family GTPase